MGTKGRKALRISGMVILVLGCIGLVIQIIADQFHYPTNYWGNAIILILGISLYWAAGTKKKKLPLNDISENEDIQIKESLSFSEFGRFLIGLFINHIEPLFDKVSDNIDWPLYLSSVSFFAKHKFVALVTGVLGGLLWLCLIPILAISVLFAIIPCIVASFILYLFRVSEKVTFKVFLWIVGIIALVIIITLIEDCQYWV